MTLNACNSVNFSFAYMVYKASVEVGREKINKKNSVKFHPQTSFTDLG